MKLCKHYEYCSYEASKDFFENVCSRNPESCLLYRWREEGQDIHKVLFPEAKEKLEDRANNYPTIFDWNKKGI